MCLRCQDLEDVFYWFILFPTNPKNSLERKHTEVKNRLWVCVSSLVHSTGVSPVLGTEPVAAQLLGSNKVPLHWSWSINVIDWKLPNKTTKHSISCVGVTTWHTDLLTFNTYKSPWEQGIWRSRKKKRARALRPLLAPEVCLCNVWTTSGRVDFILSIQILLRTNVVLSFVKVTFQILSRPQFFNQW